jgi:hypothetical protein
MLNSKLTATITILLIIIFATQLFSSANAQPRILYGTVYSAITGKPLAATVTISYCGYTQTASTSSDGSWQLSFSYGTLGIITFSATGYVTQTFQTGLNGQWFDSGGVVSLQP